MKPSESADHVHPECASCHAPFACDGVGCRPRNAFPEPTCAGCLGQLRAAFAASMYRIGAGDDEVARIVAREFGESALPEPPWDWEGRPG